MDEKTLARFWSKVDKSRGANLCWLWTAKLSPIGYGQLTIGSRTDGSKTCVGAHRFAWMLKHGPIPSGLFVCHHCDNRACCNPAHFFLGTQADNIRDAAAKGRMPHGANHHQSKLTDDIVREIRSATGSQRAIAVRFGVCKTTIGRIKRGEIWKHVHDV